MALVSITLVGPLAIHMYLPIMPAIQKAFAVSTVLTTATFSMVLFVMSFGTLVYGSASDRFGRKPVLMAGLLLFVVGSAVCAAAWGFEALVAGRLLQAMAAGCGVVLARAIARDIYGPDKLAQVIAYITAAYVLGPTLAPPIGGAISDAFGWQAVFLFASAASFCVLVLASTVIRETHRNRRPRQRRSTLGADYARLFRNRLFVSYALNPALTTGSFFIFATYASFLMGDYYKATSAEYGLYFMLLTVGFMGGNFISGRLGNRARTEFMVTMGSIVGLLTVALQWAAVTVYPAHPLSIFIPGALIGIAQGFSMPYAQAAAINAEPELIGTASGVVMSMSFLSAALCSLFASTLYDGTFLPMMAAIFVLAALALVTALVAKRTSRARKG